MRRVGGWCLGLVILCSCQVSAADSAGRLVQDTWDAAYLGKAKAGFVHTTVREIDRDGEKVLHTDMELDLTLKRFQDTAHLNMKTGTDETPEGKVIGVFMRQLLGKGQELVVSGTVEGKELHVKASGLAPLDKKVWWDDKVIGLYREQNLFKERKCRPGDEITYMHYEPSLTAVVTVRARVKDFEEVSVRGKKKRLLRVEVVPDKVLGVQLPASALWLNDDLAAVRSEVEMPGLGKLVLVRTTREDAKRQGTETVDFSGGPDIGLKQLIRLNRRLPEGNRTDSVVYRIRLPKDDDPATSFARDDRQQVKNVDGKAFELHVRAIRGPRPAEERTEKAGEEFLASNYFINSDDPKVRQLARQAVGDETDPWKKAQRIEKWVRRNMKVANFEVAMATADHVARTLEGDCTEFSMLAAAMCRAVGVPSRTAIGLVYTDMRQGPVLAFHMWTEVWVNGRWVGIDATLGQGSVGADHLKITDHSWYETQSLKPLLPLMRVMLGKVAIDVLSVNGEE